MYSTVNTVKNNVLYTWKLLREWILHNALTTTEKCDRSREAREVSLWPGDEFPTQTCIQSSCRTFKLTQSYRSVVAQSNVSEMEQCSSFTGLGRRPGGSASSI